MWNQTDWSSKYTIHSSPSLEVTSATDSTISAILLGYAVDPKTPTESNQDVLDRLTKNCSSKEELFEFVQQLSGRYVLVYKNETEQIVLPDACALRPVFYGTIDSTPVVTSNLRLALDWLDVAHSMSPEVREFCSKTETMIGTATRDERFSRVLANHYLDHKKLESKRIPYGLPLLGGDSPIQQASTLLRGTLEALNNRYDLTIWVSGGLDSRMLIAASRPIRDDVRYVVFDRPEVPDYDTTIPKRLASDLGLSVDVIETNNISTDFREALNEVFLMPRTNSTLRNVQYHFNQGTQEDSVIATGVGAEIFESFYGHPFENQSTRLLLRLSSLPNTTYSRNQIKGWLRDSQPFAKNAGIDLLDLYYWEQKMSTWGARAAQEIDLAAEFCPPFSNRALTFSMLSIPKSKRSPPQYEACRLLIEELWPECLSEPINPAESLRDSLERKLKQKSRTSIPFFLLKEGLKEAQDRVS